MAIKYDETWSWLSRAVLADPSSPVLGCISVDTDPDGTPVAAATDRHRLHIARGDNGGRPAGLHPIARDAYGEGTYPNWRQLLPAARTGGLNVIDTEELIAICSGLAHTRKLLKGGPRYYASITLDGTPGVFNPAYLADALRGMNPLVGAVRLLRTGHALLLIDQEFGARTALIMPVNPKSADVPASTYPLDRLLEPVPAEAPA